MSRPVIHVLQINHRAQSSLIPNAWEASGCRGGSLKSLQLKVLWPKEAPQLCIINSGSICSGRRGISTLIIRKTN